MLRTLVRDKANLVAERGGLVAEDAKELGPDERARASGGLRTSDGVTREWRFCAPSPEENGMPKNWPSCATHAAAKLNRRLPNN